MEGTEERGPSGTKERSATELSNQWVVDSREMIQKGYCGESHGDQNVGNIHRNMGNRKRCWPGGNNHLESVTLRLSVWW